MDSARFVASYFVVVLRYSALRSMRWPLESVESFPTLAPKRTIRLHNICNSNSFLLGEFKMGKDLKEKS